MRRKCWNLFPGQLNRYARLNRLIVQLSCLVILLLFTKSDAMAQESDSTEVIIVKQLRVTETSYKNDRSGHSLFRDTIVTIFSDRQCMRNRYSRTLLESLLFDADSGVYWRSRFGVSERLPVDSAWVLHRVRSLKLKNDARRILLADSLRKVNGKSKEKGLSQELRDALRSYAEKDTIDPLQYMKLVQNMFTSRKKMSKVSDTICGIPCVLHTSSVKYSSQKTRTKSKQWVAKSDDLPFEMKDFNRIDDILDSKHKNKQYTVPPLISAITTLEILSDIIVHGFIVKEEKEERAANKFKRTSLVLLSVDSAKVPLSQFTIPEGSTVCNVINDDLLHTMDSLKSADSLLSSRK